MSIPHLHIVRPEANTIHLTTPEANAVRPVDELREAALRALATVRVEVVIGSLTGKKGVVRGWDPASPYVTIEVDADLDDPTYYPGEFVKLSKAWIAVLPSCN